MPTYLSEGQAILSNGGHIELPLSTHSFALGGGLDSWIASEAMVWTLAQLDFLWEPCPAVIYRTSLPMLRLHKHVEQVALAEGKAFSVHFDLGEKVNFVFQPERLFKDGDSAELTTAKMVFLAGRPRFIRNQVIGGACMLAGALLGAICGSAAQMLLA